MNVNDAREVLLVHALCAIPDFPGDDLRLSTKWGTSGKLDVENRAWVFSGLCSTAQGKTPLNDWDR